MIFLFICQAPNMLCAVKSREKRPFTCFLFMSGLSNESRVKAWRSRYAFFTAKVMKRKKRNKFWMNATYCGCGWKLCKWISHWFSILLAFALFSASPVSFEWSHNVDSQSASAALAWRMSDSKKLSAQETIQVSQSTSFQHVKVIVRTWLALTRSWTEPAAGACLTRGLITFLFPPRRFLFSGLLSIFSPRMNGTLKGEQDSNSAKEKQKFVLSLNDFRFVWVHDSPLSPTKLRNEFFKQSDFSPFSSRAQLKSEEQTKRRNHFAVKLSLVIFRRSREISNDNWNEIVVKVLLLLFLPFIPFSCLRKAAEKNFLVSALFSFSFFGSFRAWVKWERKKSA